MHPRAPTVVGGIRLRRTLPGIALLLALTLGGAAADETCWTTTPVLLDTVTGTPASASGDGDGRYYLFTDPPCGPIGYDCVPHYPTPWLYEESNGIGGLQRDDEMRSDVADCTDGTRGDTIIF